MTTPISGPFTRTTEIHAPYWYGNPLRYYWRRKWYRQKKPWNLPLEYEFDHNSVNSSVDGDNPALIQDCPSQSDADASLNYAYNKAYNKFIDKIGTSAEIGASLAEARQALSMMEARVVQLYRFTKKLRRLDLVGAQRELGLEKFSRKALKKKTKSAKDFGNLWLEFHFGWEPLVKDIGSAIEVLQSNFPDARIKGSASVKIIDRRRSDGGTIHYRETTDGFAAYKLSATVTVSNPNLALASQMGFINPAAVAWELVPFSFVVDWFSNVGDVISSMTDFVGLNLTRQYRTSHIVMNRVQRYTEDSLGLFAGGSFTTVITRRINGSFPGPSLSWKPFKGFSLARGTTAISLLLQGLKG